MQIDLEAESREETTRLFEELSEGGKITTPLEDMFWDAYFGSFTDLWCIKPDVAFSNKGVIQ